MKVVIQMKTPDCLFWSTGDMDEYEKEKFEELCEKWFKYGEEVSLEIDTEKQTCTVLEC